MDKAKRTRSIWLTVLILTSLSGVGGLPGIVFTALGGHFFLMALCIALVAHALYGVTFYAIAFANAACDVRVVGVILDYGLDCPPEISQATGIEEKAASESLARCIRKGYLEGYSYDGWRIEPIIEEIRECSYCGTRLSPDTVICPSCGANASSVTE